MTKTLSNLDYHFEATRPNGEPPPTSEEKMSGSECAFIPGVTVSSL